MESKRFIKKLNTYTKWNFNFFIIWQTRKIESIFKLKDKNIHPSHIIYKGTCNCGQTYIGETARNLEVRVNEHSDVKHIKVIKEHTNHKFSWNVLATAHSWTNRRIKEAFYIARFHPQVQSFALTLFPMGTGIT